MSYLLRDPRIQQAKNVIFQTYGDNVSVQEKGKNLLKFGRSDSASTSSSTVWYQGGNETYVSTNAIDTISSSNAGDTQDVTVEGHTVDGSGNFTFVEQTPTLNGQNKVVLSTPVARVSRVYNNNSTDFGGDIYVYEDDTISGGVPNTAAKIHLKAPAGSINSSLKAATTLSENDYLLLTTLICSVTEKKSAFGEFNLQIREKGKVFRTIATLSATSNGSASKVMFDPFLIVPPNADIRVTCAADTAGTEVTAVFNGMFAIIL